MFSYASLNKKFLLSDVKTEIQFILRDYIIYGEEDGITIRRLNALKLKYLKKINAMASRSEKNALRACVEKIEEAKRKFVRMKKARLI